MECTRCKRETNRITGGLCITCYMQDYRKAHPYRAPGNGNICRCGCGEECRGSSRIHWIMGHKKAIQHCMCGCGTPVGPEAFYVQGHQKTHPGMVGKTHTTETKEKMSKAHKGKAKSAEWRMAISRGLRKSDGTLKQRHALIRKWAIYREWRTAVFERDKYTCQECGAKNGNGKTV